MQTSRRRAAAWAAVLVAGLAVPAAAGEAPHRITGPYVHENLAVYLIHGSAPLGDRTFLTLAEALDQKKVVVHETGTVGQLAIENVSDADVYVQAGEIVKGGRQDRTLGTDLVLPPRSGRVPLASHCVEQGRWSARGNEAADRFGSSQNALAHKDLKIANYAGSQGDVWSSVAKVQDRLTRTVRKDVRAGESPSSLALTLASADVSRSVADYVRALDKQAQRADAIGFAFAINGEVNSADVYGARPLFLALWPKLLQAAAAEAVAERRPGAVPAPPPVAAVQALVTWTDEGAVTEKAPGARTRTLARDTPARLAVETHDEAGRSKWIHRSYLKKSPAAR